MKFMELIFNSDTTRYPIRFINFEALRLSNSSKWTLAHSIANAYDNYKYFFEDKEILTLSSSHKITVAHLQAKHGWVTLDSDILRLTSTFGGRVLSLIIKYSFKGNPITDTYKGLTDREKEEITILEFLSKIKPN